jgi:hypothetical protein
MLERGRERDIEREIESERERERWLCAKEDKIRKGFSNLDRLLLTQLILRIRSTKHEHDMIKNRIYEHQIQDMSRWIR